LLTLSPSLAAAQSALDLGPQLEALAAIRDVNPAELSMDTAWQLAMTHPTYAARGSTPARSS
jgi:hypothetical protein